MAIKKMASKKKTNSHAKKSPLIEETPPLSYRRKGPKTKVAVKCNAGFPNNLYIRGEGAGLNWDRGTLLKNTKPDEWVWETNVPFEVCQFKILINDTQYEDGDNHFIEFGTWTQHTPHFP